MLLDEINPLLINDANAGKIIGVVAQKDELDEIPQKTFHNWDRSQNFAF
jgi:hypothetical protein